MNPRPNNIGASVGTGAPPAPAPPPAPVPAAPARPAPTPPKHTFGPGMHLLKTALWSIPCLLGLNIIDHVLYAKPLGRVIISIANHGHYTPCAIGMAAGMGHDKASIIILVATLLVWYWPDHLQAPLGATATGIITGLCIRALLHEEDHA